MALIHVEEFRTEDGRTYVLEYRDHGDGDRDYFLTTPDGRKQRAERRLVR